MGKDLAERFPAARETFERIDEALGVALSRLMWEGPESELTLTHNTQPAILAHSAAVWAVVGEHLIAARPRRPPATVWANTAPTSPPARSPPEAAAKAGAPAG